MKKPKKKIEVLFYLIKRMSRTEKRHFKLHNQIYKGKNKDFVKLFDFLNNIKVYHGETVESFWDKNNIKRKNVSIAYLLDRITETIYSTGSHGLLTAKKMIEPHIKSFHVYLKMQLLELAYKELDKAEQIANKYEDIVILFEIYELKRHVIEITDYNEEICEPEAAISQKRSELLKKITHQENLIDILSNIYKGTPDTIDEAYSKLITYQKYYDELLIPDKINANICHFFYHYMKRNRSDASTFLINAIHLWEDNPHLIPNYISGYLTCWHNLLMILLRLKKEDLVLEYYEMFKKLPQKHREMFNDLPLNLEIGYYITLNLFDIKYMISTEKYKEVQRVTLEAKRIFERYSALIPTQDRYYLILVYASYANLLVQNYTESEHLLAQLQELPPLLNENINTEIEILKLLLLYETGNKSLVLSRTRSLHRKWKINLPTSQNVLHIIDLIRKLHLKTNQEKHSTLFKTVYEEALHIENTTSHFLPFSKWIAQKI